MLSQKLKKGVREGEGRKGEKEEGNIMFVKFYIQIMRTVKNNLNTKKRATPNTANCSTLP